MNFYGALSDQYRKIIIRYKKNRLQHECYAVMRQTACLVVNPITFNNFSVLYNCTPAGRVSDLMTALAKKLSIGWLRLDALPLVGPTRVQLLDFWWSSVLVLVLLLSTHLASSQCWILIYMFAVFMHWWVRSLLRGPNNLYVYCINMLTQAPGSFFF